jgi:cytochrome P450
MEFFTTMIKKNIQTRRGDGEKRQDFLQIMLEAQAGQVKTDESELSTFEKDALLPDTVKEKKDLAVVLDDETVVAQALLFFLAGFDTTESLLTFTAYELALNPEVQEKLAEEIIPTMEESRGQLTYEALQTFEYLDMVISETLRHHPPGFATERICTQAYQVPDSNLVLPKGMRILVPINSIHHDAQYYPEPEKFNPDHFTAENKAKRHPYTYLPFGQGPRNCIAMRFALMEAKAAIAHLVYNFKIEPSPKTEIPVKLSNKTTIKKPANGMWLRFHTRETTSEGFVKL